MNGSNGNRAFWLLAALAALGAALHAWSLRWTCDDAYISFRYAQHLVQGHGLRFNLDPNEPPVEGYTNFTWTLWLALGMALGCVRDAIETWAALWGSVLHGITALLLAIAARRATGGRTVVPIAAIGWAALHHGASLAPAGLETALFVALGMAMLLLCSGARSLRGDLGLGVLGVLAAMTRPDGALFCAAAGAFVLHDAWRVRRIGGLLAYAAPFALLFAPYLLWRHSYYGYWVPNTFFAKNGSEPELGLGCTYVWEFAKCYWALFLVVPAWLLGWRTSRRTAAVALAFALPYLAFVVWVGGDFMFGRFLLPLLPALLLALDLACVRARPLVAAIVALAFASGLALRIEPPWLGDPFGNVSDNRKITVALMNGFPGVTWAEGFRAAGTWLRTLCDGLDVRFGIGGSHANLAYRAEVPVAVECAAGLTDAYIAHLPVSGTGKRGHGRPWGLYPGYLERRRVHIMFDQSYKTGHSVDALRDIVFPSTPVPTPARLVIWDRGLMAELRRREPRIAVIDFEQVLDDYIHKLSQKAKAEVAADYAGFKLYYFDHNDDAARQRAFDEFLAK